MKPYHWLAAALCALALFVHAFRHGDARAGTEAPRMKTARHPNGLLVVLPDSFFVEESSHGFLISLPGPKDFRMPQEAEVAVLGDECIGDERGGERGAVMPAGAGGRVQRSVDTVCTEFGDCLEFSAVVDLPGRQVCVRQRSRIADAWPDPFALAEYVVVCIESSGAGWCSAY